MPDRCPQPSKKIACCVLWNCRIPSPAINQALVGKEEQVLVEGLSKNNDQSLSGRPREISWFPLRVRKIWWVRSFPLRSLMRNWSLTGDVFDTSPGGQQRYLLQRRTQDFFGCLPLVAGLWLNAMNTNAPGVKVSHDLRHLAAQANVLISTQHSCSLLYHLSPRHGNFGKKPLPYLKILAGRPPDGSGRGRVSSRRFRRQLPEEAMNRVRGHAFRIVEEARREGLWKRCSLPGNHGEKAINWSFGRVMILCRLDESLYPRGFGISMPYTVVLLRKKRISPPFGKIEKAWAWKNCKVCMCSFHR